MKMLMPVALLAASVLSLPIEAATAFPNKPIRIIVAYTPAGTTDILARAIGQKMSETWGQPVIVDNRAGAAGNIGTEVAARSTPDGHTLIMGTAGTHGINVSLYRKLSWHPVNDFAPVSLSAMVPNIMVVNNSLPVKNVREFVAHVKANPGKLSYGSPGNGSTAHLSMELFKSMTGSNIVHIPYKGSAGVLADVMGGQIAVTIDNMPPYIPQVKAGKIRALAVSTNKRSSAMPDLPTIAEAGLRGYELVGWYSMVAPAGTPREIVTKLNETIRLAVATPDVKDRYAEIGADVFVSSPEEFAVFIKAEIERWHEIVKKYGIVLEP